jgi:hypothetical protein
LYGRIEKAVNIFEDGQLQVFKIFNIRSVFEKICKNNNLRKSHAFFLLSLCLTSIRDFLQRISTTNDFSISFASTACAKPFPDARTEVNDARVVKVGCVVVNVHNRAIYYMQGTILKFLSVMKVRPCSEVAVHIRKRVIFDDSRKVTFFHFPHALVAAVPAQKVEDKCCKRKIKVFYLFFKK